MLDKTRTDYQTDDGRIVLLRDAWSLAVRNPFFGVGNFLDDKANSVGKHPHNGYAKLLASHGFPPLIAMLMLLSGCIVWAFFKRKQAGQHQDLWYASYSFLIVYLVWAINFNDILREFMLSFVLVLMICSIRCGAPHAERNANVDPTVIDEPSKPLGLPIVPK
jgi:O-antigen ligase